MRAIYHHSFRAINLSESAKFGAKHMNTLVLDCDIWRYLSACSLWGTRPRGQKTLFRNCSRTIVRKEGVGEMEVWKNLQMGSPASILLSRRKESMGFLRNKCFASLFVLHISLICITGGLGGLSLSFHCHYHCNIFTIFSYHHIIHKHVRDKFWLVKFTFQRPHSAVYVDESCIVISRPPKCSPPYLPPSCTNSTLAANFVNQGWFELSAWKFHFEKAHQAANYLHIKHWDHLKCKMYKQSMVAERLWRIPPSLWSTPI